MCVTEFLRLNSRSKWREFRRFYVGYTTSLPGTAMSSVAIAFAVLDGGGTPTGLGVVFMLGGGVIAGRFGRRPPSAPSSSSPSRRSAA
jgi:uncharacterized membrane protein YdjX (TVP38/TMEM64 family)